MGGLPFHSFLFGKRARERQVCRQRVLRNLVFPRPASRLSGISIPSQSYDPLDPPPPRYHPSRLGWARSRITPPLQQTFSPRTMHPMPPLHPSRLSLQLSFTLVLHPLQSGTANLSSIAGQRRKEGEGNRLIGRSQKILEVAIRISAEFMPRFTCDDIFDVKL